MDKILLVLGTGDSRIAENEAFAFAKQTSSIVVALQVLTSGLYHYGHNDLIATRPSKRDFLCYIRDEVMEKGEKEAMRLTEEGARQAVAVEVLPVETEDTNSTVLSEAAKGYRAVFVPAQKRKLFPLLQRNLPRELKKRLQGKVVVC